MTEQLVFNLRPAKGTARQDFLIAPNNRVAVERVLEQRAWRKPVLALIGPAGSGKSHLAGIWAEEQGAISVEREASSPATLERIVDARAVLLDDAQLVAGDKAAERTLFHLINNASERKCPTLLVGRGNPTQWDVGLADLKSRLAAIDSVEITEPEDETLFSVVLKLFDDRHLSVSPKVVNYLVTRMDRSIRHAIGLVDALDKAALESGRPIGQRLVRDVLQSSKPRTRPDGQAADGTGTENE